MATALPPPNSADAHGYRRRAPLFQPSSLEECPTWRYLIANHLAHEADNRPPHHDDRWIRDTAQLLYVNLHKVPDFEGTLPQKHIVQALLLPKKGPLVVKVLECFLASDHSQAEITRKCNIAPATLAAYAAVLCDLSDHRRQQAWARLQMNPFHRPSSPVGAITTILQNTFFFGACEGLEGAVAVLCGVDGPTMADGLPPRHAPGFLRDFSTRGGFAQAMLQRNKKNCELMYRFEEAQGRVAPGTPMRAEAIDIGLQILRRVKVPKTLQKEIDQLREFIRAAPLGVTPVDD